MGTRASGFAGMLAGPGRPMQVWAGAFSASSLRGGAGDLGKTQESPPGRRCVPGWADGASQLVRISPTRGAETNSRHLGGINATAGRGSRTSHTSHTSSASPPRQLPSFGRHLRAFSCLFDLPSPSCSHKMTSLPRSAGKCPVLSHPQTRQ